MGKRTQDSTLKKRVAGLAIFGLLASGVSFFTPVANANEIPRPSEGLNFTANSDILLGGRVGDSHTYENVNNASGSAQVKAKVTIVELVNSATTRSDSATVRWETRANRAFAYRYKVDNGDWTYSRVYSATEGANRSNVVYTSIQSIQAAQTGVDYQRKYLEVDEGVDVNGSADTPDGQCSVTPSVGPAPDPCFRLVGATDKTLEVRWAKGTRTDDFFVYRYRTSTDSGANYSNWLYSPIFPSTDNLSSVSLSSDVNAVQVQRDFFNQWDTVDQANSADDAPLENTRRVGFCEATPTFDDRTPCVQDLDVNKMRAVDRLSSNVSENSYISVRLRPADRRAAARLLGRATLKIEFFNNQDQPVRFENLTLNAYDVDREEYIELEDVQSYLLSPDSTSILTVSDIAQDSRKKRFTAADISAETSSPTVSQVHSYGEARVEAQFVSIDTMFISYGFNSDTASSFDFGPGRAWEGRLGSIIPTQTISQGPRLTSGSIGNGNVGTASNVYTAVATGGTAPRVFSVASPVSGFSLNPATGQLTMESSVAAGTYTFDMRVTDNENRSNSKLVTITVRAAVQSSPTQSSLAMMSANTVSPINITVQREIITIMGTNLNKATDVFIGGVRVPIFTQSGNKLQVRAPTGLSGRVDLELKSSSNNVLMLRKLNFGGVVSLGTERLSLVVGGFAPNSRKLSPRMKNRIDRWLMKNSDLGTLTCTGFTSLPRRTTDVALSTNRGRTACNFSKRERPDLETFVSQGIEDPRLGSNVRRVRLVLTQ